MRAVALLAAALAALPVAAEEAAPADEGLTTSRWRPPEPADGLGWQLLRLPEHATRVALTPLALALGAAERAALDRRIYDLLTNEDRTAILFPVVRLGSTDGLGVGATWRHEDLLGGAEELRLSALGFLDGDWRASAGFRTHLAPLAGRWLGVQVRGEDESDQRYFGIGGETDEEDERVLDVRAVDAVVAFDVLPRRVARVDLVIHAGYHRRRLGPGEHPDLPPVGAVPGDDVTPPPGFRRTLDYPAGGLLVRYDSRDARGRTTRGVLHRTGVVVTRAVGADLGAVRATSDTALYLELAPRGRVLVLALAGGAAAPLGPGDEVPLHRLVTLDKTNGLRGYPDGRFRGRYGWRGTVEYRYPVYEFQNSGTGVSAVLFADGGRVADEPADLVDDPLRWSVGFGLRGVTPVSLLFGLQVGFSPEGAELLFGIGGPP